MRKMEARLDMFLEESHRSLGNARSPEVDTPISNRASNIMEGTNNMREPSVGAKCKLWLKVKSFLQILLIWFTSNL
ncbi:poly(ADP-ribose) glycohydrolase 1-like isoform X2 [Iris pallida]|uniref:Poly(ADP-ribose) glycohydrolase 1-like isoform X2 n=1 Tax=Iris pallida TaxID=29817 RepID=A0AAX6EP87_IRIPA|nr:poly(ADP-ribose) glycohydrolase 1-like isoform X2 [Iris pallida]